MTDATQILPAIENGDTNAKPAFMVHSRAGLGPAAGPALQLEADRLVEKFRDEEFLEKWRAAPTSTNVDLLAARASAGRNRLRVLDVCCGTGKAGLEIAKHAHVEEIVFLDRSQRALDLAREILEGMPNSPQIAAQFVCQDAESGIPPELGEFDAIVIRYAFHLIGRRDRLLTHLFQRLRPGGRLVFNFAGGNVYRFRSPFGKGARGESRRAHPFFRAVDQATAEWENRILSTVPTAEWESLVSMGSIVGTTGAAGGRLGYASPTQVDRQDVENAVRGAGIPMSDLSYELTWTRATFEDRMDYARAFLAPPVPGVWNIFNAIPLGARVDLLERVVVSARNRSTKDARYFFPEPIFSITRRENAR